MHRNRFSRSTHAALTQWQHRLLVVLFLHPALACGCSISESRYYSKITAEGDACLQRGDLDRALELSLEILGLAEEYSKRPGSTGWAPELAEANCRVARVYAKRNEKDAAIRHLSAGIEMVKGDSLRISNYLHEPSFTRIRSDPRFLALCRRNLGKEYEWDLAQNVATECDLDALPPAKDQSSLAVLDFQVSKELSIADGATLADVCRQAIQDSQRFKLVDREHMSELLSEEDLMLVLDCDNTQCLVDYGKKLRAQRLVYGRINRIADTYVLSIRMLDVGSASVVAMKTVATDGGLEHVIRLVRAETCRIIIETLSKE